MYRCLNEDRQERESSLVALNYSTLQSTVSVYVLKVCFPANVNQQN